MDKCSYHLESSDDTAIDEDWECPHKTYEDTERCIFHMSDSERDRYGVSSQDVESSFVDVVCKGKNRSFIGSNIPEISLAHQKIVSNDTQRPVDIRDAEIGKIVLENTVFEEKLDISNSEVGETTIQNCDFNDGFTAVKCIFRGDFQFENSSIRGDNIVFTGCVFDSHCSFTKSEFNEGVQFAQVTYRGNTEFCETEFYGINHTKNDETKFKHAVFEGEANFRDATLEETDFQGVTFNEAVCMVNVDADGDVNFSGANFNGESDFSELTGKGDINFSDATFSDEVEFTGSRLLGGSDVRNVDANFSRSVFEDSATFSNIRIGSVDFQDCVFGGSVDFKHADFLDDSNLESVKFSADSSFKECTFHEDSSFSNSEFRGKADFRGSRFKGGTDYLSDDADFSYCVFYKSLNFEESRFRVANFENISFGQDVILTNCLFRELKMYANSRNIEDEYNVYVDLSESEVKEGYIRQPSEEWIRVDLTDATIGDVKLTAEKLSDKRELLDYFRICDTKFDGFMFSSHTDYLDRNNWVLHKFDSEDKERSYRLEMTEENIERTYLRAKKSASDIGENKAAGEFRVKRQHYARKKFANIAGDKDEDLTTRLRNYLRVGENAFLGATCGYGLRLYRITFVFLLTPLVFGILFTIGGNPFMTGVGQVALTNLTTQSGLEKLGSNIYFSYITFLTIGYGDFAPIGYMARISAGFLVYLNVILAGLLLYSLIKRSEV